MLSNTVANQAARWPASRTGYGAVRKHPTTEAQSGHPKWRKPMVFRDIARSLRITPQRQTSTSANP